MALEFTTKPKTKPADGEDTDGEEERPVVAFTVDGEEWTARKPKDYVFTDLAPALQRRTPNLVKVRLALDFLEQALVEPYRTYLNDRLMDEADEFDVEDAVPIMTGLVELWAPKGANRAERRRAAASR